MTRQRKAILDTIRESERHLTAEEIYLQIKQKLPSIAMATVYNNLKVLVEEKKIKRLQFPGLPDHYDRNLLYHEHLICEACGEVTDAQIEAFLPQLEQQLGIHITGYHLSLYYICPSCVQCREESE